MKLANTDEEWVEILRAESCEEFVRTNSELDAFGLRTHLENLGIESSDEDIAAFKSAVIFHNDLIRDENGEEIGVARGVSGFPFRLLENKGELTEDQLAGIAGIFGVGPQREKVIRNKTWNPSSRKCRRSMGDTCNPNPMPHLAEAEAD